MIVEEITGEKFIPWEVYRDIYPISQVYLTEQGVHKSLCDRYLELRRKLEVEYALILTNPNSEFYDPIMMSRLTEDCPILTDPNANLDDIPSRLPDPLHPLNSEEIIKTQRLLSDNRFLRSLRKMGELKMALDNRNKNLLKQEQISENSETSENSTEKIAKATTDLIYAQTIIQLDGDILNRYSQEIFEHPHKDIILQIHREGVVAGERQWRGLLGFVIELIQKTIDKGANQGFLWLGKNNYN
jgi:hypothetical protein